MRYGSVCSGIEAASVAWAPLGWTPAFFSEIERFPCEVLATRHGSNLPGEPLSRNAPPNLGDMTTFQEWPDADLDVLVGGTPCQAFSVAGLRKGLADPRGNLALTYLGILDRYRPQWMVWENVPGVLSSGGGRDFGSFLGGLVKLGYGFAYRVLDAQYVTVDGFERAVPQRRQRVFVVGYLGEWRRAAAVLFEPESLRGHPAPRRCTKEDVAGTLAGGARSRGGYSADDIPLTQSVPIGDLNGASKALNATSTASGYMDVSVETFVAVRDVASTLDASFGRLQGAAGQDANHGHSHLVAFDTTQITHPENRSNPQSGDPCHPLAAGGHPPAIAFDWYASQSQSMPIEPFSPPLKTTMHPAVAYGIDSDLLDRTGESSSGAAGQRSGLWITEGHINALRAKRPNAVALGWVVRRLTPLECERLQGFPDGYTAITRTTGKPAADGPRYKALGNSMAVNVMRWIGRRIEMVDALSREIEREAAL